MKPPADPMKMRAHGRINMDLLNAYNEPVHSQLVDLGLSAEGIVSLTREQWNDVVKAIPNIVQVLETAIAERKEYAAQREKDLEAEQKAEESLQAGAARLQVYFQQGLVASKENAAIFTRTWKEHPQLSLVASSPQLVDAVIAVCRDKLAWRKPEPTPAPTPEPPVRTLSNGEVELPLDADEITMRRASIPQLRDLSKRRGEGQSWLKRGKDVGWFSSNIKTDRQSQVV